MFLSASGMFSVLSAQAASVTQLQVRMNEAEELEDVHTETAGNGPKM